MAERVDWQADGTPRSARFDDIYRTASGGLEQARHVFLRGCGLPQAWARASQWRIFETGFGLGLNFLAAWRAWKDDPQRPRILHFVSVEAWPVAAEDIVRSASAYGELTPLADELARRWWGLTPGAHRFSFEGGHVLLTLHVRDAREMLRSEPFTADSVFLDGFDPHRNPDMWDEALIKSMARHCRRGTRLATWTVAGDVRRALAACGFEVHKADGLPPKRSCTQAVFEPGWEIRPRGSARDASDAIVIGAGLAGSAAASSFARRGWRVTLLDAGDAPASGASALPVGLLAPHASPDDNLLSRLSRAGVRMTLARCKELLAEGTEWQRTAALEILAEGSKRMPGDDAYAVWQRDATVEEKSHALVAAGTQALVHERAAWIRPAALVRALLRDERIEWRGQSSVTRLEQVDGEWIAHGDGGTLARAPIVVVAAAYGSRMLLPAGIQLNPVRGQIAWAAQAPGMVLPSTPVNGNGHFIPSIPIEGGSAWYCGSTYGRGDDDSAIRDDDTRANLERLRLLLPEVARQVDPADVHSWAQVRCTSHDRRPVVGEIALGLFVSTAMGSRGLTFCILAGEMLASLVHDEPLPLDHRLAQAIGPRPPRAA